MKILNLIKKLLKSFSQTENNIFYLSSTEALPCPLNIDEELTLIKKLGGEEKELAKAKLIEHNIRLVVYIAKKFENTQTDLEDLISIGSIGLIKAVNSFSPEKNIKLATYASRCIENEILMYLRKIVKQKGEISLEEPLNTDSDGNELVLEDILSQDKDNIMQNMENEIEKEILKKLLNKLSDKEKLIITWRYGLDGNEEKTQKEVADLLNISQSYISRIEKKILQRLKKDMTKIF